MFETTPPKKRVGIFGGSFNPPHRGHTEIVKWLFARGIIDELFVIPCFLHPFDKELLPFEDRFAMCRLAFDKLGFKVTVSDIEKKLGGKSFTLRSIQTFQLRYPDARFYLITGSDVAMERAKWHRFDEIESLVEIVRLPRGLQSPIPPISSTEIRERLEARQPYADLLEPEVAVYIITKGLFK